MYYVSYDSESLFHNLLKKESRGNFGSILDFPRNSKSKWTLKWLPLERGYFKFYFHKGENILIILCHTYLLTRNFFILFQIIFVLPCILFLFKISRNLVLLIDHPSKRGDVETLARSSISPSPQVKMKFKLTASR